MGLNASVSASTGDADGLEPTLIEVHQRLGQPTAFTLHYPLQVMDGDFPTLVDPRFAPDSIIQISTSPAIAGGALGGLLPGVNGSSTLVRGPVHGQRAVFTHGVGGSVLQVHGSDESVLMDRESKLTVWEGLNDSNIVSAILATHGLIPDVESTMALHTPLRHAYVQRGTDLFTIRQLANRNGFHFWVTTNALGLSTGHFRKPPSDAPVEAELVLNVETQALERFELSWDTERPTSVQASQLDPTSLQVIDGSVEGDGSSTPLATLGGQGLASIATETRSIFLAAPSDDAAELSARAQSALVDADFFIRARGVASVERVGSIIQAHSVVTVRGLGSRHSGDYLVAGVDHRIDATGHRMGIELLRNAWGAG